MTVSKPLQHPVITVQDMQHKSENDLEEMMKLIEEC